MDQGLPFSRRSVDQLRTSHARLAASVASMEAERRKLLRERRFHLAMLGLAISLPLHIMIMIWLGRITVERPGPPAPQPVVVTLATLDEQTLNESPLDVPFRDLSLAAVDAVAQAESSPAVADSTPVVAELSIGTTGSLSVPGGGGGGVGAGLAGGTGGTTFFGTAAKGVRFAYIVDSSGSMEADGRFVVAMRELGRSLEALPDFAYFYVLLFSSDAYRPAYQEGWQRARRTDINRMQRWLRDQSPSGGTYPLPAFEAVFALDVPPDVIFFMTDGAIPEETPKQVARLNSRGRKAVIHTIAFGDQSGRAMLQRIAEDSGGTYRFVSAFGN